MLIHSWWTGFVHRRRLTGLQLLLISSLMSYCCGSRGSVDNQTLSKGYRREYSKISIKLKSIYFIVCSFVKCKYKVYTCRTERFYRFCQHTVACTCLHTVACIFTMCTYVHFYDRQNDLTSTSTRREILNRRQAQLRF